MSGWKFKFIPTILEGEDLSGLKYIYLLLYLAFSSSDSYGIAEESVGVIVKLLLIVSQVMVIPLREYFKRMGVRVPPETIK